jgi:translation initiation factor IF-1
MPEPPIQTVGVIRESLGPAVYRVELPNGKLIYGHLSKRLADLAGTFSPGVRVPLELPPYDFEKARIAGPAAACHE